MPTLAFALASCAAGSPTPRPTPATVSAPSDEPDPIGTPSGQVTSADFEEWPFVADAGTLLCDPSGLSDGRLLVRIDFGDGIEYALNGQARTFGFPELDTTVMPDWPNGASLGPIIERGLELCDR